MNPIPPYPSTLPPSTQSDKFNYSFTNFISIVLITNLLSLSLADEANLSGLPYFHTHTHSTTYIGYSTPTASPGNTKDTQRKRSIPSLGNTPFLMQYRKKVREKGKKEKITTVRRYSQSILRYKAIPIFPSIDSSKYFAFFLKNQCNA